MQPPVAIDMTPRDAATLVALRNASEVLLGMRNEQHVFMRGMYVFPGGAMDSENIDAPAPLSLRTKVTTKLGSATDPRLAKGLAMAAVRETWEETGLLLGARTAEPVACRLPGWQAFYSAGLVPALDRMDYLARAITPPGNVRRFDARFFLVDAAHLRGKLQGTGELLDLRWVALHDTEALALSPITAAVLEILKDRLWGAERPLTARGRELRAMLLGTEVVKY